MQLFPAKRQKDQFLLKIALSNAFNIKPFQHDKTSHNLTFALKHWALVVLFGIHLRNRFALNPIPFTMRKIDFRGNN